MSLGNEDESSGLEAFESVNESEKKPRVSYTREFLLSLSELEICKSLPSGFDQSILREFEGFSIHERPRTHGNPLLQGFRRSDYSSSPPTRGDSSNFSRGGYGRWDSRSSGWSDKDGDSQSDMHSDSGRSNYGNQSRRPWQKSEHDGLLGSGSFPRPSGFSGGSSAPKDHHHLNRSNEAYQPPRPFKAGPPSRPNTHDSFNDETFGSIESTSQDRAEEERKRRASFELMRKEQQKVLQEKQKMNANKVKSDEFTDLVLEEIKEERVLEATGELKTVVQSVPKDDTGKSSILSQSSKPRPLVPPGFKSTILEKSSTTKPASSIEKEQNPKPGIEEIHLLAKGNYAQNGTLDNQVNIQSADHHLHRNSGFSEVHETVDGEVFELATNKIISNSSQESTSSLLGKIFGSGPTIKDSGPITFLEQKSKPDDPFTPLNAQSSKFAQWFNEEEKKGVDDLSSSRPNDLLSLIGGGDKAGSQVPGIISTDPIAPELPYKGFGITEAHSGSKHLFNNFRQESAPPPVAAVLTCEDLEQTIISEYSEKGSNLQPPVPDWSVSSQENADAVAVNNHATHHLLSLLQKGTAVDDGPNANISPVEAHPISEKPKDGNNQEAAAAGQNLSLEALFGTAFMKELQSAQAPVSAQRAPPRPSHIEPNEISASNVDGMGSAMINYESNPLSLRQKQPAKSDDLENLLNFDGQRVGVDSSHKQAIGAGEIQLPEEESLIIGGDPANTRNSNIGNMLPAEVAFDISEKLAVLNSGNRFVRGPYDMLEPERQFNNHNRPMFHPLDPNAQHLNSQMKFPEHLMQRDTHLNQQFPGSMPVPFHHPDARVTGFDVPVNVHPQMLPQMRMQGNIPPPHMLRDLQRPQASNIMRDHGFPFPHQQTNIGGLGLPLPVADGSSGSNHPEALQRMMEMERWAQSKQVRPVNTGQNQGMYGHGPELDMGFRYR